MSNASALARSSLNLRRMTPRDLPHVLHIAKNLSAGRLALKHFLKVFQSGDAAGWVAEKEGCVVGFLIYTVTSQPASPASARHRVGEAKNVLAVKSPCVNLLNIVVAPEWRRQGIGRSMLEILDQGLWRSACAVQVVVPETNLPLQLFFRAVGYRAIRVLRECFEGEDAYLMERQQR